MLLKKRLVLINSILFLLILLEESAWAGSIWFVQLPVSGVEMFWPVLVFIGFAVGVIGGFFGMGGGWMVTPVLNLFGFPIPFAIGTDLAHIAGKSIISTIRHWKFSNVDIKMGFNLVIFTMAGVEVGARCTMYLEKIGIVGPAVRWIYIGFLLLLMAMIGFDIAKKKKIEKTSESGELDRGLQLFKYIQAIKIPPMIHFETAGLTCSFWMVGLVGFITGWLAGILGIGGGLFRMPALLYFIGCPTYVAIGTDLFGVCFSGLYGAFTYTMKGRMEIVAVIIMLFGAAIGAQIGTIGTKYVRGYLIRALFGLTVVVACVALLMKQFGAGEFAAWIIIISVAIFCAIVLYLMIIGAVAELKAKNSNNEEAR